MYREAVRKYIEAHKEEMVQDLSALIRIDSSKYPAEEGKPLGAGSYEVFQAMEGLIRKHDFQFTNYDNYAITADFSDAPKKLDVLCHLDVVPGQEGWKITEPFVPKLVGDRLYGRGTSDDKGPAIAALYAMKALKELKIPMDYSLRLILGGDEETGATDMDHYYEKESYAEATISPDSSFPLVYIEKGMMGAPFIVEIPEEELIPENAAPGLYAVSIHAGVAGNVIPSYAEAGLRMTGDDEVKEAQMLSLKTSMEAVSKRTGTVIALKEKEEGYLLTAEGHSAHGSLPEQGVNSLTALLEVLAETLSKESRMNQALINLHQLFPFGAHYGEGMGIAMEDEKSGKLTLSFNIIRYENGVLSARFDCRIPMCATKENCLEPALKKLREAGLTVTNSYQFEPHYLPEDSELFKDLMGSYESVMGVKKAPLAIGGCTYIHGFPNAVAFGCMEEDVDNHIHAQDEFIDIPHLLDCVVIMAEAFRRICTKK